MTRRIEPFDDARRLAFVTAARGFKGARWRHQGRRADAMDCLGLIALSLVAVGAEPSDRRDYGRTPYNRELAASLRMHFGDPVLEPQPGDVVTMSWGGEEHHVAIVSDHPEGLGLIHAVADVGRVVEHRLSPEGRIRIVETFRP